MAELPPFELWFASVTTEDLAVGEEVAFDVISISRPPSDLATWYRSMYVFGNHLWVVSAHRHLVMTNSGVVIMFEFENVIPLQWSKPNGYTNWICWVDWKDFRVGLWEVPSNCTSLQLGGGKLWKFCCNHAMWWIWVHSSELLLNPTFSLVICISNARWTSFFSFDVRQCGN